MAESAPSLGRQVQLSFEMFTPLPDFGDMSLRDYQETMQRPFFSLAKKRVKPIHYLSPNGQVSVHVSANPHYGMATIWDADIMIFFASYLNEQRQRSNQLSPTIRVHPADIMKLIRRDTSGRAYERLRDALDRLQATTIKTNICAKGKSREVTFSWIDSWTQLIDERRNKVLCIEVTLAKWFFDGVLDQKSVLSVHPAYFDLKGGIERWLYRAARKHAGGNGPDGFTIGFDTLLQKSGSEQSAAKFKASLMAIARADALPELHIEVRDEKSANPKLWMVMRKDWDGTGKPPSPAPNSSAQTRPKRGPVSFVPPPSVDKADLVSPEEMAALVASTAQGFRVADAPGRAPARTPPRRQGNTAKDVIDPETYAAIRRDFPGWDLDVLMARFDSYIAKNLSELPANYSKRFYFFMKSHHQRNKHNLPRA
ncbi:replication initiator protein A [Sphingobium chungbukense]|uniref:Replication protein A n=1 Tax=Sphingobium chungbukense TaxID=56193 RepID=A0A0M3AKK4_9SPHN|nr:replication initiator protein A [Sphingobium chungbukense]KKW89476.1 replication protein A [Sphingobium chungbukense]